MGHLFAADSLQTLWLSSSNNDRSVALFTSDLQAYNKVATFGFRRERAFHLDVREQSKLGHFHYEWDKRVQCLHFVRYMRLNLTASSSMPVLSHVLLSVETL